MLVLVSGRVTSETSGRLISASSSSADSGNVVCGALRLDCMPALHSAFGLSLLSRCRLGFGVGAALASACNFGRSLLGVCRSALGALSLAAVREAASELNVRSFERLAACGPILACAFQMLLILGVTPARPSPLRAALGLAPPRVACDGRARLRRGRPPTKRRLGDGDWWRSFLLCRHEARLARPD